MRHFISCDGVQYNNSIVLQTSQRMTLHLMVGSVTLLITEGTPFTTWTNHGSLKQILDLADGTGKLRQWHPTLLEMEFDVVPRASNKHHTANSLSQLPKLGESCTLIDNALPFLAVSSSLNNMEKDASNPTTSLTTAKILALAPSFQDYPPSLQVQLQGWMPPHPLYCRFWWTRP